MSPLWSTRASRRADVLEGLDAGVMAGTWRTVDSSMTDENGRTRDQEILEKAPDLLVSCEV
jgi:hypothetical protein